MNDPAPPNKGVVAVALLAIRARLAHLGHPGWDRVVAGDGTPADTLKQSSEKDLDWHKDLLGFNGSRLPWLFLCVLFKEGRLPCAYLSDKHLPADEIAIDWDGDVSGRGDRLEALYRRLEARHWPQGETPRPDPPAAQPPPVGHDAARPLKIALLRGTDLAYVETIQHAFASALGDCQSVKPLIQARGGVPALWPEDKQKAELKEKVENLLKAGPFDYHVGIGTQACRAWKDALGDELGADTPFIFMGVTFPIEEGLIRGGLQERNQRKQVSGVSYNDGALSGIAGYVFDRILTPEFYDLNPRITRRPGLRFLYRADSPQDRVAATFLRAGDLERSGDLTVRETPTTPTSDDFDDPDGLYISWFTFEAMYQDGASHDLLVRQLVVATTRMNVENGWAAVGVSADDDEIGREGARILIEHRAGGSDLGKRPIHQPRLKHWINRRAARRLNLVFPEAVLKSGEVFD